MYRLIILEEADKEFQDAAKWYEQQTEGLGLRFIEIIKRKLEIILEHPERNARKKGGFREAVVKTFPYIIVYTFYKKESVITISSIFHTSRNPRQKFKKRR